MCLAWLVLTYSIWPYTHFELASKEHSDEMSKIAAGPNLPFRRELHHRRLLNVIFGMSLVCRSLYSLEASRDTYPTLNDVES